MTLADADTDEEKQEVLDSVLKGVDDKGDYAQS